MEKGFKHDVEVAVPVHSAPVLFEPANATRKVWVSPSLTGSADMQCDPVPSPPKRAQPFPALSIAVASVQPTLCPESASQHEKMKTTRSVPGGEPRITCE